jgi:hypothetical protein
MNFLKKKMQEADVDMIKNKMQNLMHDKGHGPAGGEPGHLVESSQTASELILIDLKPGNPPAPQHS